MIVKIGDLDLIFKVKLGFSFLLVLVRNYGNNRVDVVQAGGHRGNHTNEVPRALNPQAAL